MPDNVISVHNLETFALKFILHKTKGATVFAVDIKVCAQDQLTHTIDLVLVSTVTVEPRLSGPGLSGFLDYPDFFSSPNFVMNIHWS